MRYTPLASLGLALMLTPSLGAQQGSTIARRVATAPDGEVRLAYATRPDVCGDGRDGISVGHSMTFYDRGESYGSWGRMRCVDGPARVTLAIEKVRIIVTVDR